MKYGLLPPVRASFSGIRAEMINLAVIKHEMTRLIKAHATPGLVVAVYVFGSSVRSDFRNASDIDLAFLVDEQSYKKDPFEATAPTHMIAAEIGMAQSRETDVAVLNAASLEIAYEIIIGGRCVYESDPDARLQYELKIRGMYFDFKPFLEELRAKRIKALSD
jgi:predicted nucleotidyltransferase